MEYEDEEEMKNRVFVKLILIAMAKHITGENGCCVIIKERKP